MPNSLRIGEDWIVKQPTWMKVAAVLVFGFIMVTATFLSWQDYQTSRLGYLLLPSQKLDPEMTATLVGGLPQAFQIAMAWVMATRKKGRKLALILFVFAFLPDFLSDVYFKSQGVISTGDVFGDAVLLASVLGETFFLYTFGSEFMLMFAWSNLSPLLAPTLGGAVGGFWRWLRETAKAAYEAAQAAGQESGGLFGVDEGAAPARQNGSRARVAEGDDEDDHQYGGRGLFDGKKR